MRIKKRTLRFIEFLLIGIIMGMFEDILAVFFVTGQSVNLSMLPIVFIIALPFAFVSEYVVDNPRFWENFFKIKENKKGGLR